MIIAPGSAVCCAASGVRLLPAGTFHRYLSYLFVNRQRGVAVFQFWVFLSTRPGPVEPDKTQAAASEPLIYHHLTVVLMSSVNALAGPATLRMGTPHDAMDAVSLYYFTRVHERGVAIWPSEPYRTAFRVHTAPVSPVVRAGAIFVTPFRGEKRPQSGSPVFFCFQNANGACVCESDNHPGARHTSGKIRSNVTGYTLASVYRCRSYDGSGLFLTLKI